jgi:glycerophosphoryl diester phosphodiesterase
MNEKRRVLIIGHRGASNIAPENTLKAFQKAIELGADYIEFDNRLSKDSEIVVMHDNNTLRTTGHNAEVRDMTLKELKSLDCGEGEQIPTLLEVIEIAKGKIGLQIEVCAGGMAEQLVSVLRDNDLIQSSIISSFQYKELLNIQKLEPNLKLAFLWLEVIVSPEMIKKFTQKAIRKNLYAVHPPYKTIDIDYLNFAHKNNLKVNIWTVNSKEAMKKFIQMGVDGIITDNIQNAKKALNK